MNVHLNQWRESSNNGNGQKTNENWLKKLIESTQWVKLSQVESTQSGKTFWLIGLAQPTWTWAQARGTQSWKSRHDGAGGGHNEMERVSGVVTAEVRPPDGLKMANK